MQKYINKLKDRKFIIVYIIIVLLVVALLVSYFVSKNIKLSINQPSQDEKKSEKQNSTSTTNDNTGSSISYSQAVQLYANKTIQFDENCSVNPSYASFKQGEKIMLDNRGSKQRSVYLDNQEYIFSAYDFKIINLSTSYSLPHTIMINCGSGKNNGRILLQQ